MVKLYSDMSASEQAQWVEALTDFVEQKLPVLEQLGEVWEPTHRKDMETGLDLISAFGYARAFVEKSLHFGDYSRRVYRMRFYIERIKNDVSSGMSVQTADGQRLAYIPAMQTGRRRGRPTREEAYMHQRGLDESARQAEQVKRAQAIAKLCGIEIVTNLPPREKNNEELAADRAARAAEEAKIQPSLFQPAPPTPSAVETSLPSPAQATLSSSALPHLDQIGWLLSDDLRRRANDVRNLRATAAASAERAKVLAEQGENAEEVATYAQAAADNTEAYERVYADVDAELATVYARLKDDETFRADFVKHYNLRDTTSLLQQLKPYYTKADASLKADIQRLIDDNNPAAVAAREAAVETKKKADAIIKYLRRTDKPSTPKRLAGMEAKMQELIALIGEDQAKVYQPFIDKTREDVEALIKK